MRRIGLYLSVRIPPMSIIVSKIIGTDPLSYAYNLFGSNQVSIGYIMGEFTSIKHNFRIRYDSVDAFDVVFSKQNMFYKLVMYFVQYCMHCISCNFTNIIQYSNQCVHSLIFNGCKNILVKVIQCTINCCSDLLCKINTLFGWKRIVNV